MSHAVGLFDDDNDDDVQTSVTVGLFDDNDMEDVMSHVNMVLEVMSRIQVSEEIMDFKGASGDATRKPDTTTTRLNKRERLVDAQQVHHVVPDKRRIKEVDYSEELRKTLYSQEEWINTMRRDMQMENRIQQQQQLQDHIKETCEAFNQANRDAIEGLLDAVRDLKLEGITSIPKVTSRLILIVHASSNDLESLFYILFEFAVRYRGAHGETTKTLDKSLMPWSEAYENLCHPSGMSTGFFARKGPCPKVYCW
ncbi:hypothetical protein AZE42_10809 [Rhizopogon vesiculosus]|uniref:Uncharacterized protein n=1 Tax=Rhizopogon vesiculosus TaxID=180088 RepID=A0A1J8QTH9_9AGAM|nr:hypothetical protein AZE42_10809 [Rhizopogon vesiculosus]